MQERSSVARLEKKSTARNDDKKLVEFSLQVDRFLKMHRTVLFIGTEPYCSTNKTPSETMSRIKSAWISIMVPRFRGRSSAFA